jgi:hypothetical protein
MHRVDALLLIIDGLSFDLEALLRGCGRRHLRYGFYLSSTCLWLEFAARTNLRALPESSEGNSEVAFQIVVLSGGMSAPFQEPPLNPTRIHSLPWPQVHERNPKCYGRFRPVTGQLTRIRSTGC